MQNVCEIMLFIVICYLWCPVSLEPGALAEAKLIDVLITFTHKHALPHPPTHYKCTCTHKNTLALACSLSLLCSA